MPDEHEIPAPVTTTTRLLLATSRDRLERARRVLEASGNVVPSRRALRSRVTVIFNGVELVVEREKARKRLLVVVIRCWNLARDSGSY